MVVTLHCASTAKKQVFWISLWQMTLLQSHISRKRECCIYLRNTVIGSVRGLTLVYLLEHIHGVIPIAISTNPLTHILSGACMSFYLSTS